MSVLCSMYTDCGKIFAFRREINASVKGLRVSTVVVLVGCCTGKLEEDFIRFLNI